MNLIATGVSRFRWVATQTEPMPPCESLRSRRYFPAMTTPLCKTRLPAAAARITPERSPREGSGGLPRRSGGRCVGGGWGATLSCGFQWSANGKLRPS